MNLYAFHNKPEELNGYEDRIYYIPQLAYYKLLDDPNRIDKDRLEDAIAKSEHYSYLCAENILHAPFPKGEDVIAKNYMRSYRYAKYILKRQFPKGEDAISKDPEYSYLYAKYILKGRFLKGEDVLRDSEYWNRYQKLLSKASSI